MWFDLLRFKTIYEIKNLTHTAIALNITQPALSKSLKRIEDYFDCTFFSRSKSGLTPNKHAEMLYRTILEMENRINNITNTIHPPSRSIDKKMTIGLSKVWNYVYFPLVLKQSLFLDKSSLLIRYDRSLVHYKALREGRMDFALVRFINDPNQAKDIIFNPIFQTRHALFCLGGEEKKGMKIVDLGREGHAPDSLTMEGIQEISAEFEQIDALVEDIYLLIELLKTGTYKAKLPIDFKEIFSGHGIYEVENKARYFSPYWCGVAYAPQSPDMDLINELKLTVKNSTAVRNKLKGSGNQRF